MTASPAIVGQPLTRDQSATLFSQTMGLVALTTAAFALGAYAARDVSTGWIWFFFIAAFVTLQQGLEPSEGLKNELRAWVAKEIGSLAKPDDIRFSDALPKTRSREMCMRTSCTRMRRMARCAHARC